jgi:hypothetical protein
MREMVKDSRQGMHIVGDREDFVNIGKTAVRLSSILS